MSGPLRTLNMWMASLMGGDSALNALTGSRYFATAIPQGQGLPSVVWRQTVPSGEAGMSFAMPGFQVFHVEIGAVSEGVELSAAAAINDRIYTLFERVEGLVSGWRIYSERLGEYDRQEVIAGGLVRSEEGAVYRFLVWDDSAGYTRWNNTDLWIGPHGGALVSVKTWMFKCQLKRTTTDRATGRSEVGQISANGLWDSAGALNALLEPLYAAGTGGLDFKYYPRGKVTGREVYSSPVSGGEMEAYTIDSVDGLPVGWSLGVYWTGPAIQGAVL